MLDLLQARDDAQTAIVVYAGSAHSLVPLSDDLLTSSNLLESLKPSIMPVPGRRADLGVEKALQLLRIPYHLSGGTAFLDRGEVKDALAWLRLLANPDDDAAFLRAVQSPNRGVGAGTLAKLGELAAHAHLPLARAAESITLAKQLPARAANALQGFASLLHGLRNDARTLPPAELVRKLPTPETAAKPAPARVCGDSGDEAVTRLP